MRLDGHIHRQQAHLDRMQQSAAELGFYFPRKEIEVALQSLFSTEKQRVRLLLERWGRFEIQVLPFGANPDPVRAVWARTPRLESLWLRHKSTERTVYNMHREGLEPEEEVLLWNDRGEITEFSTGNIVIDLNGRQLTPPLSSGLLAGIERTFALKDGVSETILYANDVKMAQAVWHLNSLRGWRRVTVGDFI